MSFKHQLAWYNASKVYVNGSNQTDTNKTQIAPSGASFLRCTVAVASWSTFQVEAGTAQTTYVPYSPASLQLTGLQTTGGTAKIVYPTYTGTTVTFDANVALPKTIYALVGQELNIYYDGFNTLPDYGAGMPSYAFNITCTKGISTYRSFQYTPSSGETGSYPITIDILDNYGAVLQSVSSTIVVVARSLPATVKNILILGDSTWHNGGTDGVGAVATQTLGEIFTAIGGNVPVFFGQQQPAPYKNECRSARTYTSFASGATCYKISFSGATPGIDLSNLRNATYRYGASSNYLRLVEKWVINGDGTGYAIGYNDSSGAWTAPTVFPATMSKTTTGVEAAPFPSTLTVTGVDTLSNFSILKDNEGLGNLNISYYVETVLGKPSGTTIDVVSIDLGINDTSSPNANISTIMSSAKSLVAAFKAHNPSIKIIICYPKSKGADNFNTTRKKIKYTMQALRKALLAEFDGNPSNPNVYMTHSGAAIDRFYGYQMTTTATSGARYTDTSFQFKATGNDVHPGNEGNQQIGDAVSGSYIVALS